MGQRFGFGWALLLAAVLVWTGACTASRPPTPTPTAPTPEPTPTAQAPQAGPAVEITATQAVPDQAAEGTATPEPDQDAGDENTATPTEQQPQDQATGKAAEDAEQLSEDLLELQQAFQEFMAQYPDGYTENIAIQGAFVGMGGEIGAAQAAYLFFEDLLQSIDPSFELWSAYQRYLRNHPNAKLVVALESERAIACKEKWNDFTCSFTGPIQVIGVAEWFAGRPVVRKGRILNSGVAYQTFKDWDITGFAGGKLPVGYRDSYGYWTNWKIKVYLIEEEDTFPLMGVEGRTRMTPTIHSNDGDAILEGGIKFFEPSPLDPKIAGGIIKQDESEG